MSLAAKVIPPVALAVTYYAVKGLPGVKLHRDEVTYIGVDGRMDREKLENILAEAAK